MWCNIVELPKHIDVSDMSRSETLHKPKDVGGCREPCRLDRESFVISVCNRLEKLLENRVWVLRNSRFTRISCVAKKQTKWRRSWMLL